MKKLFVAICAVLMGCNGVSAHDVMITVNQLPAMSQTFLTTYFDGVQVSYVTEDRTAGITTGYEVRLVNGVEIEFERSGDLHQIECKTVVMPEGIVPAPIMNYVRTNFQNMDIKEYKVKRFFIEVKLINGLELEFDKDGNFVGVDD